MTRRRSRTPMAGGSRGLLAALLAASLSLVGCSAGPSDPSSPPTRAEVPEAWRTCTADEDCAGVDATCCACGQGDYVGVRREHEAAARDRLEPTDCRACPSQDCPPNEVVCRDGQCAVVDR